MKIILMAIMLIPSAFAWDDDNYVIQRDIPLVRIPICRTWIPEGRTWGCVNFERRDMADRKTIEALVDEIKDLKDRIQALEQQM